MEKQRIQWIDYAKAFAIFGVVLLHAHVPYPAKGLIHVWIIPLFFFLSGIFANTNKYATLHDFLVYKGFHILIPYFCFNIINYLFWFFLGRHYGYDASTPTIWWKPLIGILYGEYSHLTHYIPLWFLACLFTTETLFYLIFRHIRSKEIYWITVGIVMLVGGISYYYNSIVFPWGISIAFPMMVFYAVGNYFAPQIQMNNYRILKMRYIPYWGIVSLIVVLIIYHLNPGEVRVYVNEYGNYILFYIGAFAGILCMHCICRGLEYCEKYLGWLSFIGQNTLIILCLHLNVFSLIKGFTYFVCKLQLAIHEETWMILCSSILNIIILVPIILFINRYVPFITGKICHYERIS